MKKDSTIRALTRCRPGRCARKWRILLIWLVSAAVGLQAAVLSRAPQKLQMTESQSESEGESPGHEESSKSAEEGQVNTAASRGRRSSTQPFFPAPTERLPIFARSPLAQHAPAHAAAGEHGYRNGIGAPLRC